MEQRTYNGWTNHDTWLVALHLDNHRSSYEHWRSAAIRIWKAANESMQVLDWKWTRRDAAAFLLAEEIREALYSTDAAALGGLHGDLLRSALAEINFPEIADHYLADLATQDEQQAGHE